MSTEERQHLELMAATVMAGMFSAGPEAMGEMAEYSEHPNAWAQAVANARAIQAEVAKGAADA